MLEIKITIESPDMSGAINNLACAILDQSKAVKCERGVINAAAVNSEATPVMPVAPETELHITQDTAAAMPAPAPAPAPVVKEYTLDNLATAAAALIDEGKMEAIMAIIQKYGVPAINLLRQDQYASFADDLRSIGGKI